ncbi:uncharacterized protein N7506_007232 [Penicillium brevicompactum]|uniref:uncharacterized protein n=1 Tax=Penicillium brevicompactum TaxID=5074 RepID=UPI0025417C89|nr:uncharacterized protein N7506_007232 [Penicillium brevicompactum]KAJ5333449.1 hypothetical protein N7506_007232 [Penicillium brevicompactum]
MKATLFLLGVLAAAASVAEAISIKSGPLTRTNRNCDGSADGPVLSESFGTATITRAANLIVSVPILFKGTPNSAYNVRGVGNTNVVQAVKPGATAAWIAINKKTNCNDFYTLQPLPIT